MRLSKILDLGEQRKVILRELRVSDIHNAIGNAELLGGISEVKALADPARLDGLLAVLGDCVEFVECTAGSLAFSEIPLVFEAFREVNAAFFKLLALAGISLKVMETGGESLGGPAAPSSSGDTGGSSITDGVSS